jgi:hypothetical protein
MAVGVGSSDVSWDGQSTFVKEQLEERNRLRGRGDAPANYVVDFGAHDGIWLSNSYSFVRSGWGALLVEPFPGNFANLASTWPESTELDLSVPLHSRAGNGSEAGEGPREGEDERSARITLAHAAVGLREGVGKIMERGWLDNTEVRVLRTPDGGGSSESSVPIVSCVELLLRAKVPKRFALLTFDVEWADSMKYALAVRAIVRNGWRPEFLILETIGDPKAKEALESAGYTWIRRMRYDDIFARSRDGDAAGSA